MPPKKTTKAKETQTPRAQGELNDSKDNIRKVTEISRGSSGNDTSANGIDTDDEMYDNQRIVLKFYGNKDEWGEMREQKFSVVKCVYLRYCFDDYAKNLHKGITRYSLRFLFDGKRLDGEKTAADYELEDGDQIDVFEAMTGEEVEVLWK